MPQTKHSSEGANAFKNDGSFLELFRKKMEQEREQQQLETTKSDVIVSATSSSTLHSSNNAFNSVHNDEKETLSQTSCNVTSSYSSTSEKTKTVVCTSSGVPTSSMSSSDASGTSSQTKKASLLSFVGKRRGSKPTLKTGVVKKRKTEGGEEASTKEPWAQYLSEVKKYRNQICSEDDSNRPLVK